MFLRAVGRRLRRRGDEPAVDPAVTRGLRALVGTAAVVLAGMVLVALRFELGWPDWVRTLGFRAIGAAILVIFPLALWLGWRMAGEEVGARAAPEGNQPVRVDRVT